MRTSIEERIRAAISRITSGHGCMRIPAEETDPDLVLADCLTEIKRLRAQWQPIESAPKDGTRLMLWDSRAGGYAVTGAWVAGSADDHETITHWQPLPAAPEVEG